MRISRDHARQQRPKAAPRQGRATGPKRAAAPRRGGSAASALGLPLWAWMVVSLSLIVLAAVIYTVSRPTAPMAMAPSSEARVGRAAAKTVEIPPKEPARFAFYEMLPSYEVVVPDEVLNPPKPKPGAGLPPPVPSPGGATTTADAVRPAVAVTPTGAASAVVTPPAPNKREIAAVTRAADVKPAAPKVAAPAAAPAAPVAPPSREREPTATAELKGGERFLIQVAAYRTRGDAEQRQAALAMSGLSARIEQVTIDNRESWYRVRLGPYGDAGSAAAAQHTLKSLGFAGVVMKVRP